MRLVLLLGASIAAAVAVVVWRTQHGAEVWHTLPATRADIP